MKLRRFNEKGTQEFEQFLDTLTSDVPLPIPTSLLTDPDMSEQSPVAVEIEPHVFANRFQLAEYFSDRLPRSGIRELEKDKGLWAWLSLYFFDQLCPVDGNGRRKPGNRARWIPATTDYRKYYRHLLAGPYRIYRAHRDNPSRALALLSGPLDKPGDIVEQLASRQEIITNKAIVETATKLYIDTSTKRPKRGAAGKSAGSARRLAEVLNQFDVTWDLSVMDSPGLLTLLPKEFDRFRPTN
jgi:hypothetical protein